MMRSKARGTLLATTVVGLAVAIGMIAWLVLLRGAPTSAEPAPVDPKSLPFYECAAEVGLDFRMHFLPKEQGERFKVNLYDHGAGLAVGDFEGTGREGIYFCNQLGKNALYRNKGDGTFEDVTARAGVGFGDRICVGATFADYDNDGKLDLFVTSTRGGNVLFRNMGDGTFKDVTKEAGLTHIGHTQAAVFFDYDNDGRLDLFITNTAEWTTNAIDRSSGAYVGKGADGLKSIMLSRKEFNRLYHNNGDGTFTDVTEKAGLKGMGWAGDAVAFDYNEDGFLDVFVCNMFGRCQLYRNNGDGTFTDVTLEVLGRTPFGAVGAGLFDSKNNGHLDLYVVDMHSDMWLDPTPNQPSDLALHETKKFPWAGGPDAEDNPVLLSAEANLETLMGFKHDQVLFGNGFYRNEGGKFTEVSDQAGLETWWPWSVAPGDFDNDGHVDVFSAAGMGYPWFYWGNYLLMNQGDGTFRNRASELGIEPPRRGIYLPEKLGTNAAPRSSRCAVTADFRGEGLLDIVVNNFNDQPYFFKNQFPRKNYVEFRLRGTRSNRDAIGAVVRLYQGNRILTRQVQSACGYLSHSSRTLHFGLGDQATIDRVEITWPSGQKQQLPMVAANRLHEIIEPTN
jgi:hypothetical protein